MAGTDSITRPLAAAGAEVPSGGNGDAGWPDDGPVRPRRPRRRRLVAGAAVLAVAGVAVALTLARGGGSDDATPSPASTATAPVEVRTLSQTEEVDGTLDFGESRGVVAGSAGTVTGVADEGSTVGRGDTLFSIDQHPTVLLVGDIPLYRDLAPGVSDGPDVAQLEQNLAELGHTDSGAMAVDEHFDTATADAVEAWQEERAVDVTGTVTRADAVFLPGAVRIAGAAVDPGASVQAGATVVEYTGSTRVVRAQIEPGQADIVHVGDAVTIALPDGTEVAGTVATVADGASSSDDGAAGDGSGEATAGGSEASGGAAEDTATIELTVTVDDQAAVEAYTTAGVGVELTGRQREDVLAVPVTALVALAGTGYAVEVPQDDGTSELVPVEPGMYADGFVEVSGEGIEEGTDVVVAEP
jgi:peptidoglycan hydrolase-like protein with peptidoglycan-binding domain